MRIDIPQTQKKKLRYQLKNIVYQPKTMVLYQL